MYLQSNIFFPLWCSCLMPLLHMALSAATQPREKGPIRRSVEGFRVSGSVNATAHIVCPLPLWAPPSSFSPPHQHQLSRVISVLDAGQRSSWIKLCLTFFLAGVYSVSFFHFVVLGRSLSENWKASLTVESLVCWEEVYFEDHQS